jgi:hypothetical protein
LRWHPESSGVGFPKGEPGAPRLAPGGTRMVRQPSTRRAGRSSSLPGATDSRLSGTDSASKSFVWQPNVLTCSIYVPNIQSQSPAKSANQDEEAREEEGKARSQNRGFGPRSRRMAAVRRPRKKPSETPYKTQCPQFEGPSSKGFSNQADRLSFQLRGIYGLHKARIAPDTHAYNTSGIHEASRD